MNLGAKNAAISDGQQAIQKNTKNDLTGLTEWTAWCPQKRGLTLFLKSSDCNALWSANQLFRTVICGRKNPLAIRDSSVQTFYFVRMIEAVCFLIRLSGQVVVLPIALWIQSFDYNGSAVAYLGQYRSLRGITVFLMISTARLHDGCCTACLSLRTKKRATLCRG